MTPQQIKYACLAELTRRHMQKQADLNQIFDYIKNFLPGAAKAEQQSRLNSAVNSSLRQDIQDRIANGVSFKGKRDVNRALRAENLYTQLAASNPVRSVPTSVRDMPNAFEAQRAKILTNNALRHNGRATNMMLRGALGACAIIWYFRRFFDILGKIPLDFFLE